MKMDADEALRTGYGHTGLHSAGGRSTTVVVYVAVNGPGTYYRRVGV